MEKPRLEDFYDETDPRGCSSSEYTDFEKAVKIYNDKIKETSGRSNKTQHK